MIIKKYTYPSFQSHREVDTNDELYSFNRRNEYVTRLCVQTSDTLKAGGHVMMLTFTYNNENLPFMLNPETREKVPTFDRYHVRSFLNRLKVSHRRYNHGSYKYFLCMEYGKRTKRQHLHGLFFLTADVDLKQFIDNCRNQWYYGFMFPANSSHVVQDALLRNPGSGASYAAKYVCKDLSYYNLPSVQRLHDCLYHYQMVGNDIAASVLKDCFPRIYQSNGIGCSLLDSLREDFKRCVDDGIVNPLTKKIAPIPRYVLQKYLYSFTPSFDGRVGKNGKQLYDRILTASDEDFLYYKTSCLQKSIDVVSSTVQLADFVQPFCSLKKLLSVDDYTLSKILTIHYNYASKYSMMMSDYIHDYSELYSVDNVMKYNLLQSDTYSRFLDSGSQQNLIKVLFPCDKFISLIDELSTSVFTYINNSRLNVIERLNKDLELRNLLRKCKYDPNVC